MPSKMECLSLALFCWGNLPQGSSKTLQDAPKTLQDSPGPAQDLPKTAQDAPKMR